MEQIAKDEIENVDVEDGYGLAVIDADSILYRAAAGAGDDSPVEHALHNVKTIVEKIFDMCQPDAYTFHIGGDKNFRFEIATIKPYKGNRVLPKPVHLQACREYLLNNWGAEIADNEEADDACGIEFTEAFERGLNPVLVHIDKDLDQHQGWHFNYPKNEFYWVGEFEGKKWFYQQMLWGDSSDNIPGINGLGEKKSKKLLEHCTNEIECAMVVEAEYRKQYGDKWFEAYTEVGRLLYMRKKKGEMWCPILTS